MSDFTWRDPKDTRPCPDPAKVGCDHALGGHAEDTDGCSYIGPGGWCGCPFVPAPDRGFLVMGRVVKEKDGSIYLEPLNGGET